MNLKTLHWAIIVATLILIFILLIYVIKYPSFSYLSSIFILLGTLLVAAIQKLVNTINQENKTKLLTKKVFLTVHHNLKNNLDLLHKNKDSLSVSRHTSNTLYVLDTYFWDSVDKRMADIEIEYHIIDYLLSLKIYAENYNKLVEKYNKAIKSLNSIDRENSHVEFDKKFKNLTYYSEKLEIKTTEIINLADSLLEKIQKKLFE